MLKDEGGYSLLLNEEWLSLYLPFFEIIFRDAFSTSLKNEKKKKKLIGDPLQTVQNMNYQLIQINCYN